MMRASPQRLSGFTMAELLVAVVLGLVVGGMALQLFITSSSTQQFANELGRMNSNGSYALARLERLISTAGNWGCVGNRGAVADTGSGLNIPGGAAVSGTNSAVGSGSDTITVRSGALHRSTTLDANASNGAGNLQLANGAAMPANANVMVADCQQGDIVQLGGGQSDTRSIASGQLNHPFGQYDQGTPVTFAHQTQIDVNNRCLRRTRDGGNNWNELLCRVDQLQLRYGVDTDGDNTPNQYMTANNVGNWGNVLTVRAALVMRSSTSLESADGDYRIFGQSYTSNDGHARRTLTKTVPVRSRLD